MYNQCIHICIYMLERAALIQNSKLYFLKIQRTLLGFPEGKDLKVTHTHIHTYTQTRTHHIHTHTHTQTRMSNLNIVGTFFLFSITASLTKNCPSMSSLSRLLCLPIQVIYNHWNILYISMCATKRNIYYVI